MKKALLSSVAVVAFSICSCDSTGTIEKPMHEDVNEVFVTVKPMEGEMSSSRLATSDAVEFIWEFNDTIGIFPSQGGQVEFPITEESVGKSSANFTGGGWALKAGYSYSAYYPFDFYNRNATQVPISYLGQTQDGRGTKARAHLSDYVCLASGPVFVENGALRFPLSHVGSVLVLTLTLPEATTYTSLSVFTDAKVIPVRKTINIHDAEVTETVTELSNRVTLNLKDIKTTQPNEEVVFWLAFPSVAEGSRALKVVVYDKYGYSYVGNICKNTGEQAMVSFTKNKFQRRYASPVLTEGFNFGVGGWGSDGTDHGGSVN